MSQANRAGRQAQDRSLLGAQQVSGRRQSRLLPERGSLGGASGLRDFEKGSSHELTGGSISEHTKQAGDRIPLMGLVGDSGPGTGLRLVDHLKTAARWLVLAARRLLPECGPRPL